MISMTTGQTSSDDGSCNDKELQKQAELMDTAVEPFCQLMCYTAVNKQAEVCARLNPPNDLLT